MLDDEKVFGEVGNTDIGEVVPTDAPAEKVPKAAPEQGDQDLDSVPFHQHPRWKEVYSKAQRVDALEKQLADLTTRVGQPKPQEDEWQPKTWREVQQKIEQAAVQRVYDEMNRQREQSTVQQQNEDRALDEAISSLKAEKGEFDQKKLLETAWKYQVGDLSKAYEIMQMEGEAEKRGEKQALRKKVAPIGSSKKTEGGAKAQMPYKAFKRRSLDDIVADAAERISG